MWKILWITNTVFPDAAEMAGMPAPVSGGWMYSVADDLSRSGVIDLAVATVCSVKSVQIITAKGIKFFLLPFDAADTRSEKGKLLWEKVAEDFLPDVVHIHGTEFPFGNACMKALPDFTYLVSIQGLVSVCDRYYLSGMSWWDVLSNISLRDLLRQDSLFQARTKFRKKGLIEKECLSKVTAVIGRTAWDYDHLMSIRRDAKYFFCNESLREEFYCDDIWQYEKCKKYSIFLSQAAYPLKGLHQVLKAISIIKDEFPSIVINVAGPNIIDQTTVVQSLKMGGYGRYILGMINDLNLTGMVTFTGNLSSLEMKNAYLSSHVFICPSSIENSPNSLGEAQILGVPTIASYVGGIPSMVNDGIDTLLYRFEEHEMLAGLIRRVFNDREKCERLSFEGRRSAQERHDREHNLQNLMGIYKKVLSL